MDERRLFAFLIEEKIEKLTNRIDWRPSKTTTGTWEVLEYQFLEDGAFSYRTVIRGIDKVQAEALCYMYQEAHL